MVAKNKKIAFTSEDVRKIAKLANIPVSSEEEKKLADGFSTTLSEVDGLFSVNVRAIPPVHQVTGLENIYREDVIDESQMFSHEEALSNAKRVHKGYFVVKQILEE